MISLLFGLFLIKWCICFKSVVLPLTSADQVRNSYQLCNNGTLRVIYANGMGISYHTEPHILAGSVSPTIGRRNITLPTDNGLNSIEWRLRKELTKGKVTVFGRKLRVSITDALLGFHQTLLIDVDSYVQRLVSATTDNRDPSLTFFLTDVSFSGPRTQPAFH